MIRSLAGLFMHDGSKVERAAVVSDLRGGEYFERARAGDRDAALRRGRAPRALPLRRRRDAAQPLQGDAPAPPARAVGQRDRRHPPRGARRSRRSASSPTSLIDTRGLSAAMLRRKIANELLERESPRRLAVTFGSFGHKHGPPRDADLAFDVRFLPNPHYEPELRAADRVRHADRRLRRRATAGWRSSTTASSRCSSTCCRSTCARARRTSWSRSDAPAGATARSSSPSTSPRTSASAIATSSRSQHRDVDRAPTRA